MLNRISRRKQAHRRIAYFVITNFLQPVFISTAREPHWASALSIATSAEH